MSNLRIHLRQAEEQLHSGPHPDRARQEAEALALHILKQDRAWLIANAHRPIPSTLEPLYSQLIQRRHQGEPIQYITGHAEFYGLPFHVAPGVLIPRPETEHLAEELIRLAQDIPLPQIADIGTGSGAIAIAAAHALPSATILATDLSEAALTIAKSNAQRNHVSNRITFLHGDLLAPAASRQFHIIASNPPYISIADHDSLAVEVRSHEPHSALFAPDNGLALYQRLIPDAHPLLHREGWLLLEIGYNQQSAIEALLQASHYSHIHFLPDYQGIPRVAAAQKT